VTRTLLALLVVLPLLMSLPAHAAVDLTDPGPWLVFDIALGWGMGPADYDGRAACGSRSRLPPTASPSSASFGPTTRGSSGSRAP